MQDSPVRIAFLDQVDERVAQVYESALPAGWTLVRSRSYDEADQVEAARDADVLFVSWTAASARVMSAAPGLRLVQKLGVGTDRVDIDHCREHGVAVARLAGVNAVPVAEHVVLMILAALRQLPRSDRRIRTGEWFKEEARGFQRELRGRTVALIGLGHVGREVAKRLRPFEVDLRYHDPRRLSVEEEATLGIRYQELDEALAEADIVSLHLPLLPSTHRLLDDRRLRLLPRGAYLVNCARGGLIDEAALDRALRDGHLAGAALDCFEQEPVGVSPLFDHGTVVVTPHVAGATADNVAFVARRAYDNVRRYLAGDGLPVEDVVYLPAQPASPVRTAGAAIGGNA